MRRLVISAIVCACLVLVWQYVVNWHTIHGLVYKLLDDKEAASIKFRAAIDKDPNNLYAQFYLGHLLFEQGAYSSAIPHLRHVITLVPTHHKSQYLLGLSLAGQEQLEPAIEAIKRSIELNPSIAQYHFQLGLLFKDSGNYQKALDALRAAADNGMSGGGLYFNRGYIYLRLKQPNRARQQFQLVQMENPDYFIARLEMARLLAGEHKYERAIREYQLVTTNLPDNFYSHYELSKTLQVTGELEVAYQELEKARQLDPKYPELHNSYFSLGIALKDKHQLATGIKSFSEAIDLAPNTADYYYQLGLLYKNSDKPQEAVTALQKAASLGVDSEILHFSLGYAYKQTGNLAMALKALRKVVAINPRHQYAHGEIAKIHTIQDRIGDAIDEFLIDIEITPDKFFSYYDLGLLYKKKQQLVAARKSLEKAVMLNPDYPHTCKKLREIYELADITENRIPNHIQLNCNFESQTS